MSIFKIIITAVGIIAALFSVLIFSGRLSFGTGSKIPQGSITVWGTLPQDQMTNFFLAYAKEAKGQQVTYQFVKEDQFSETLVEALASGVGPDAIIAPYQIILEQSKRIYPFPQASLPEKMYRDMFVDGASIFWTRSGALALPIAIEPMVLFFNRTLLAKHGVALPPEYWDELNDMGPKLTILTPQGTFTESAIALGAFGNVLYAKDILSTVVAQLGQTMVFKQLMSDGKDNYSVTANAPLVEGGDVLPLATALRFFMEFSNPTKIKYTWNQFLPNAQDQFVAEKLALYIGYYGEAKTMRERNGRIDFDVAPLPQTRGYNTSVTGMKLYGMATLVAARNKEVSFAVQSAMASSQWSNILTPTIGALPPQRTYTQQPNVTEALRKSLLVARGWYDLKPKESSDLFEQMIRDVTSGRVEISEAATQFVQRLRAKYTN